MPVYFEGKRKKVRYGKDLVEVRFGKKTKKEAFAVFSADDNSLNFYKRVDVPKVGERLDGKTVTEVYTGIENGIYTDYAPWYLSTAEVVTNIRFVDKIKPQNTAYWFNGLLALSTIDFSNLDTSRVESMEGMFYDCYSLTEIDVSMFDTSSVTNMMMMFNNSVIKSLDLSNFETSSVTKMSAMFMGCYELVTLDISGFTILENADTNEMFTECNKLQKVKLGDKFVWRDSPSYLPAPSRSTIPNADGKWYALSDGKGYAPENIPSNKADTYYAYPPSYKYTEIRRITARAMETTGDTFISISKAKRYRASLTLNPPSGGIGRNIMSVHIYDTNSGSEINIITVDRYNVQYFELQPGDYRMYGFFDCQTSGYQGTLILEEEIGFEFAQIN